METGQAALAVHPAGQEPQLQPMEWGKRWQDLAPWHPARNTVVFSCMQVR